MQKEIVRRSPVPYYLAGLCWLVYSLIFPFYRLTDMLVAAILSCAVFFLGGMVFKPSREIVEVEESFGATGNAQADEMIARGQGLLKDIREVNNRINHPELSAKISALEDTCRQMFGEVRRRPEKAAMIRRALDYYLPVVLKMLNSYDNMEGQAVQGGTVKTAMGKIEGVMDTVLQAFRNQLDSLYKDEALDISTDITVLQGMLTQEGLIDGEINPEKQGMGQRPT
ncbi:MAG: 5-bromo-4-chloroindolyl phosphate hydrolysis family protein [Clostridiales bacterium]|nr:5-bromo-4-chloroindolyl phosphate hydrolysis family protein [Clostridiales bacterium]